jgi:hypothetical protein
MFGKILNVLDKILTFFEDWTLFITVFVALIAMFFNVVLRYGFNYSLAWSEELVREVIIYTTFIGCSAAVKNRSMIKIDALVQLVPKLKIPLNYISNLATLIFALMILYSGLAGGDPPENDYHADSPGLSFRDLTPDGRYDVYSNDPGNLPGRNGTTHRQQE